MKKAVLLKMTGVLFIIVVVVTVTLAFQPKDPNYVLMMKNIEALAGAETETSWNCDASNKTKCKASCPSCGTIVSGTGALSGSHSCSK